MSPVLRLSLNHLDGPLITNSYAACQNAEQFASNNMLLVCKMPKQPWIQSSLSVGFIQAAVNRIKSDLLGKKKGGRLNFLSFKIKGAGCYGTVKPCLKWVFSLIRKWMGQREGKKNRLNFKMLNGLTNEWRLVGEGR